MEKNKPKDKKDKLKLLLTEIDLEQYYYEENTCTTCPLRGLCGG